MDLPIALFRPLLEKIGEPFLIVLLIIIWWQFKSIGKKDTVIEGFHKEVRTCGTTLAELTKMIEVLVYGRNTGR